MDRNNGGLKHEKNMVEPFAEIESRRPTQGTAVFQYPIFGIIGLGRRKCNEILLGIGGPSHISNTERMVHKIRLKSETHQQNSRTERSNFSSIS